MANPISRTAYYTLAVRAWDASLPKPVCGDAYASRFMDDDAQHVWREFKDQLRPNTSNASRHAIIDRQLQTALDTNPASAVVIIGAGFDTRAFRLKGGKWIEVDEAPIINLKESKLPSSTAPNQLTRLPIDFALESLLDKLAPYSSTEATHVVIEGVLMYLPQEKRLSLLQVLQQTFPEHIIYCDLMRKSFFERYSKPIHEKIVGLGASFTDLREQPEDLFLENGYKLSSCTSIPLYAAKHANLDIPAFVVRYFMKTLRDGYRLWQFRYPS
ncbi:MAG: class I SAM-dependent methyltransferase [Chryseosolibacter sp.]